MPWAHDDPQEVGQKAELLRRFRGQFDLGQDFVFGIFAADESEVLGGTGLHTRAGDGGLEIGYWVRADRTRRGIATSVAGGADEGGHRARRRRPHRDPRRGRQRAERHDRAAARLSRGRPSCAAGFRPRAAGIRARRARLHAARRGARWLTRGGHRFRGVRLPRPSGRLARPLDLEQVGDHHVVATDRGWWASESSSTRAICSAFASKTSPKGKKLNSPSRSAHDTPAA